MERFAFKVDKVLRANLSAKICRLCGIDNPDKIPILREDETDVVDVDAEPELAQKIQDCIGIQICKDDKMPQMICSLCVDKINDFFEFREMCYATNIQTRKLLGIKEPQKKDTQIKVEVKSEVIVNDKRCRKRKSEETESNTEIKVEVKKSKLTSNFGVNKKRISTQHNETKYMEMENLKDEIKNEQLSQVVTSSANSVRNPKLKALCKICNERFTSKFKLERHKSLSHSPNIPRYICSTCDETLKKNSDIKSHQLWHKLSKTPYTCGLCRECLLTTNLFTRHLRDHSQRLSTPITVLDRECSQCNLIFCTNFLYNTHPCVVGTKMCGGCNKQIKNEIEYKYHAANCENAYLTVSKYLCAAIEPVRIKNENDVEAANDAATLCHVADLTPIVSLTELSGDLLQNAATNILKNSKKGNKKGLSKKDLKRVDDLLKSTMDTLVSIKHEPEMHVDTDAPNTADRTENNVLHTYDGDNDIADDFHNRDDSDDDCDDDVVNSSLMPIIQMQTGNEVVIKQEPVDTVTQNTVCLTTAISVKKELPDSGYEDSSNTITSVAKVPVLKLKITKEHGMLNSSLVDENLTSRDKKKKKKKRKDSERNMEQIDNTHNAEKSPSSTPANSPTKTCELTAIPLSGVIQIKQERLDDDYVGNYGGELPNDAAGHIHAHAESTVMTSIPMMQFQISRISSGVEFNETETEKEETIDVKPNRAELDSWLKASHASSTAETAHHNTDFINTSSHTDLNVLARSTSSGQIPKIVAVRSGVDVIMPISVSDIRIKTEPSDDGYEQTTASDARMSVEYESDAAVENERHNHNNLKDNSNSGQAFIDSIDFSSVNIKQEKDIEVSEPQVMTQHLPTNLYNGLHEGAASIRPPFINKSTAVATEEPEHADENEDDNEEMVSREEIEKPEFRELSSPPPLGDVMNNPANSFNLRITHVRSQAEECSETATDLSIRSKCDSNKNFNNEDNEKGKLNSLQHTDGAGSTTTVSAESVNKNNSHTLDSSRDSIHSKITDPAVETTILKIIESAETLLKAKPPFENHLQSPSEIENTSCDSLESINEEHQNILNSDVLAASEISRNVNLVPITGIVALTNENSFLQGGESGELVEASTSTPHTSTHILITDCNAACKENDCNSTCKKISKNNATTEVCNEETENFINENMDAQRYQDSDDLQPSTSHNSLQRALVLDDRNVNEIAENNNNANIERELLDDDSSSTRNNSTMPLPTLDPVNDDDIT